MTPDQTTEILNHLFPGGYAEAAQGGDVFAGQGDLNGQAVHVVGTWNEAHIGADLAHAMTGHILRIMTEHPGAPILMMVDNAGQRLSRRDEMLGNNAFLANLAKALEVARRRGHAVLSLVYGRAVSGGFLATGMSAAGCFALAGAEIGLMSLDAMARVTRVPKERLEELSKTSAIFSPGAENFRTLGVIEDIWTVDDDLPGHLAAAIKADRDSQTRRRDGTTRGGRSMADTVSTTVRTA